MPSSTSSSDDLRGREEGTTPRASAGGKPEDTYWVRPLPERRVPAVRFGLAAIVALAVLVPALAAWEWQMRRLGLTTDDIGDGQAAWAVERRKVDRGASAAIVGDSRLLFGTDLAVWEQVAGVRPVQLALPGTPPHRFLSDLARDPDFRGLAVVSVTPNGFFRARETGLMSGVLDYYRDQSPSNRFGHGVDRWLQRGFAFLDDEYRLAKLLERASWWPAREGTRGPEHDVWKISVAGEDRQTFLWQRIETDERLRLKAMLPWQNQRSGAPRERSEIDAAIARAKADVELVRAKGGEVVFVRAPSSGRIAVSEEERIPRAASWEPLLAATGAIGFHYADHPATAGMTCPEESHLTRADAAVFTRVYVEYLQAELAKRGRRLADFGTGPRRSMLPE